MNPPKNDKHKPLQINADKGLKTPCKRSHNRDIDSAALIALVKELARQAAQMDFDAQQKLH